MIKETTVTWSTSNPGHLSEWDDHISVQSDSLGVVKLTFADDTDKAIVWMPPLVAEEIAAVLVDSARVARIEKARSDAADRDD